jgi:hypothetical protein
VRFFRVGVHKQGSARFGHRRGLKSSDGNPRPNARGRAVSVFTGATSLPARPVPRGAMPDQDASVCAIAIDPRLPERSNRNPTLMPMCCYGTTERLRRRASRVGQNWESGCLPERCEEPARRQLRASRRRGDGGADGSDRARPNPLDPKAASESSPRARGPAGRPTAFVAEHSPGADDPQDPGVAEPVARARPHGRAIAIVRHMLGFQEREGARKPTART